MPLKIALKAGERVVINGAVLRVSTPVEFTVENRAAILREKDILTPEKADTPARRIYLLVQMACLSPGESDAIFEQLRERAAEIAEAAPSLSSRLINIGALFASGQHFRALKAARALIRSEKEILDHAHAIDRHLGLHQDQ